MLCSQTSSVVFRKAAVFLGRTSFLALHLTTKLFVPLWSLQLLIFIAVFSVGTGFADF